MVYLCIVRIEEAIMTKICHSIAKICSGKWKKRKISTMK
jgi:hypothetical protein